MNINIIYFFGFLFTTGLFIILLFYFINRQIKKLSQDTIIEEIIQKQVNEIFEQSKDLFSIFVKERAQEFSFSTLTEKELSQLERNASEVWVLTTHLENDATPGPLRDSVEHNLNNGVKYSYYLPDLSTERYLICKKNLKKFINLRFVTLFLDRIKFIHLPLHNIFLYSEVVIYNPNNITRSGKEVNPTAYTYIDTEQNILVKIPDFMLKEIISELQLLTSKYLPLSQICDTLITTLQDNIDNETIGELIRFKKKDFIHKSEFDDFIGGLYERVETTSKLTKHSIEVIYNMFNDLFYSKHPGFK